MDTSETYIKMCDCPEIQILYESEQQGNCLWDYTLRWEWDRSAYTYVGYMEFGGELRQEFKTHDGYAWHCLWLPRQDQLQEMIGGMDKCLELVYWWQEASKVGDYHGYYHDSFDSMEQLWLAFVMKEKYNKVWNGEEWDAVLETRKTPRTISPD